ncbi:MAG TPA: alpha/beta fold hydrolase [Gemmatimonadales bacterium]|nr:alpha/beta fold hydrolase [Gemmatimonadales bacterium]
MTTMQRIRSATTRDRVEIAYYAIGRGRGAPLVYLPWGITSHVAHEWEDDEQRHWLKRLAVKRRVIRFDHRGTGLSDRRAAFTVDGGAHDIDAVVRREGLQQFALLGQLHSAASAIRYASQYPERVSHLILWCGFANYREFLESSPPLQAARAAADKDWHTFTELIAQLATGWADGSHARRFAKYLRECATAEHYVRCIDHFQTVDLTPRLVSLTMPVLVLQPREAAFPTIEVAKRLCAATPGARLVLLKGATLLPFLGDVETVATNLDQFLTDPELRSPPGGLTEREAEILERVAGGFSNQGIARELAISVRTVERHIGNVYLKIGAHNRAQATAYAIRKGLISGVDTRSIS